MEIIRPVSPRDGAGLLELIREHIAFERSDVTVDAALIDRLHAWINQGRLEILVAVARPGTHAGDAGELLGYAALTRHPLLRPRGRRPPAQTAFHDLDGLSGAARLARFLRDHPATAGELAQALPIARPGVSRHLRVLREAGLVDVRQDAQRRIYTLRPQALVEVDEWLGPYRALWRSRFDALHTEIARGKKTRK